VFLKTCDFKGRIIMTKPKEVVSLGHEYVNLTHRLFVNGSLWQGYHILRASTEPDVDSLKSRMAWAVAQQHQYLVLRPSCFI
jgi:hypothetical protein